MKKVLLHVTIIALLFSACEKKEEAPQLDIDQQELDFSLEAASKNVNVSSDATWTVTAADEWCTVTPSTGTANGSITVNVTENDTPNERQTVINLKIGDKQAKSVSVKQAGVKGQRLVKLSATYRNETSEVIGENEFFYDNEGRLVKTTNTNIDDDHISQMEFFYSSNGDLIKTVRQIEGITVKITFLKIGNTIHFSAIYSNDPTPYTGRVTLNNSDLPVEVSEIVSLKDPRSEVRKVITYDAKNNPTERKVYDVHESFEPVLADAYTYTFDDKISPFRDMKIPQWWFIYSEDNNNFDLSIYNNQINKVWVHYLLFEGTTRTLDWPYQFVYDGCNYPKYCYMEEGTERIQYDYIYEKW